MHFISFSLSPNKTVSRSPPKVSGPISCCLPARYRAWHLFRMATEFTKKVIQVISAIPEGKVATYGQIAELAGKAGAARGVSWILHSSSKAHRLPWQRVLGARGRISFPKGARAFREQRRLLEEEKIVFKDNGTVDLAKFQWKKKCARVHHRRSPSQRK